MIKVGDIYKLFDPKYTGNCVWIDLTIITRHNYYDQIDKKCLVGKIFLVQEKGLEPSLD